MAQKAVKKTSSNNTKKINSSNIASSTSNRETKNALKIVATLLLLFFIGVAGGIVFYYVTYGELPAITESSAGIKSCPTGFKKVGGNIQIRCQCSDGKWYKGVSMGCVKTGTSNCDRNQISKLQKEVTEIKKSMSVHERAGDGPEMKKQIKINEALIKNMQNNCNDKNYKSPIERYGDCKDVCKGIKPKK